MKNYKKILLGVALAILITLISTLVTHNAEAACVPGDPCAGGSLTTAQLDNATYKLVSKAEIDATINNNPVQFIDKNPLDSNDNFKPQGTLFCSTTKGITLNASFSDLQKNGGNSITADVSLDYRDVNGVCRNYTNTITFTKQADGSFVAAPTTSQKGDSCTGGADCVGGVCSKSGGDCTNQASDGNACEANNNTGLEWLFCGILRGVDDFVSKVNSFIDGQLNFNIKQNLQDPAGIKQAWNAFRILASSLLVLVMLIIVISQAISVGPFDAYTVRKLLPKMVAAIILIQISWYFSIWLIELANALGQGIAGLLAAPFGGTDQLGFDKLMGQLGVAAPGIFVSGSLLGTAAALLINPFGALMLAFVVLIGVITALAVLLIRQALIIACVIFLPVALVAWILPGTNRYWKLLWDNFTKALLLFPLIVAMITTGRIFAWIVGTGGGKPGILDLFAIVIGFFGPYFLLPKAFKWGGNIMSTAGNAINGAVQPLSKSGRDSIKGMGDRYQGAAAKKYDPNETTAKRALRRFQSGHFIPSVPGLRGAAERSRRLTIASGNKWASERTDEAEAFVGRTYEKALNGYDTVDMDNEGNYVKVRRVQKMDRAGNYLNEHDEIVDQEHAAYLDAEGKVVNKGNAAFYDKDNNVVDDYDKAHKEVVARKEQATGVHLTGVAAAKQALVDIAGNDTNTDQGRRAAQAAHKQLLDTSSWIEIQKARVQSGKFKGRRVSEVDNFRDTLENSPQHYSATIRSRPDMAPDVIESAENNVGMTYNEAYEKGDKEKLRELDKERLQTTLKRLSPDAVPSLHFGIFEDIAKLGDADTSDLLKQRLEAFRDSGTTVGSNAIGSLTGAEMQKKVEKALSYAEGSPKLENFLPGRRSSSSPGVGTPKPPTTPAPPGSSETPSGIVIPPTYRPQAPREEPTDGQVDINHDNES